jgi:acyl carrier protein
MPRARCGRRCSPPCAGLAPEVDPARLRGNLPLREELELELDSMDFLSFVIGLHERLGVEVPEADCPRLLTLDDAVRYLAARRGEARGR